MHYSCAGHNSILAWEDYKDRFIYKKYEPKKDHSKCNICKQYYKNLGKHISGKHKNIMTAKDYFDKYLKKEDNICRHPDCNNKTTFIRFEKGYHIYCSVKCTANDEKLILHKSKLRAKTLTNDPEILIRAMEKRKLTYLNFPEKEIRRENNTSIGLRNHYNQLADPNCDVPYFLYIIKHLTLPIIKIGRSKDPENRLIGIIKDFGNCEIIYTIQKPFNKIYPLEIYLHNHFNKYCQVQPTGGGRTEWFCESILEDVLTSSAKFLFDDIDISLI